MRTEHSDQRLCRARPTNPASLPGSQAGTLGPDSGAAPSQDRAWGINGDRLSYSRTRGRRLRPSPVRDNWGFGDRGNLDMVGCGLEASDSVGQFPRRKVNQPPTASDGTNPGCVTRLPLKPKRSRSGEAPG